MSTVPLSSPSQNEEREKQLRMAKDLLGDGQQALSFAKGVFRGRFEGSGVFPYPRLAPQEVPAVNAAAAEVRQFVDMELDARAIDRDASIPRRVIDALGRLGVLGMTVPPEYGGRGFSQLGYCRIMEIIGGACASTSVFINAHRSIGMRALLLFGTPEQKQRWLPALARGEQLAAFALTEPEAGSDAGNVQTQAIPSADGGHYILNGEKRYITNGAIAGVLTVMARAPGQAGGPASISAFLVTPDMHGFQVTEARMEKLGIRGTTTSRLAFTDMPVPRENVLGSPGKGLKVALTVLDFGRTTFGACCTGAAKTAMRLAAQHANTRRQFGRTLGGFELVKRKIAMMAANIYAMEAMTTVTAGLIDRGQGDYVLETAMLKVFCTESLWTIINDSFQIHGGPAYFTDMPLERMLRDARINQIGEGANDVLRSFIALVGMRGPGEHLKEVWDALHHPLSELKTVWRFGIERAREAMHTPDVPVASPKLRPYARELGELIHHFDATVRRLLIKHREEIIECQYRQARIADCAIDLFAAACVLSRLDMELGSDANASLFEPSSAPGELFLRGASGRIAGRLNWVSDNDDDMVTLVADQQLGHADLKIIPA